MRTPNILCIFQVVNSSVYQSPAHWRCNRGLQFDEPTSVPDPGLVGEVPRILKKLALEEKNMVMMHEMEFSRHVSNRLIFLNQGKI